MSDEAKDPPPPNLRPFDAAEEVESLIPSAPWKMASAVMVAFASEGSRLAETGSPAALRRLVHGKYMQWLSEGERVRRWKRERWIQTMFLTDAERILMADLIKYADYADLESKNGGGLPVVLGQIRSDMDAVRRARGNVPTGYEWKHATFLESYLAKRKRKPELSYEAALGSVFADLGLPLHLYGLTEQVVRPLQHLARNLPLLPGTIGVDEFDENSALLYALPAAAVQIPPLRLGSRFHIDAIQEDVILGGPFQFAALVRAAACSHYIRSSPTKTHPVTLRLYMNSRWPKSDEGRDLPLELLDGSSDLVRNVVVYIPSQTAGETTRVVIYIDSSDYCEKWALDDLDLFERQILLPNVDVESYYYGDRIENGWSVVTRWKAYVAKDVYQNVRAILASEAKALLYKEDRHWTKLYTTANTLATARPLHEGPTTAPLLFKSKSPGLSRGTYAYRVLPMQDGNTCTAYAFTVGAFLTQLGDVEIDEAHLKSQSKRLKERAGLLYRELLPNDGSPYTTLPEAERAVPGGPPQLSARELPPLMASIYPYIGYTSERLVQYGPGKLALAGMKDWVKKLDGRPGRLKQLITSICNSPHLRQYSKKGMVETITEPAFFLGFTRDTHTIMVFVAPATITIDVTVPLTTKSVRAKRGYRYFYFDSLTAAPAEAVDRTPDPIGFEVAARLLSFSALDDLDAYFSERGGHGVNQPLDMNLYVDTSVRVEEAFRRHFNEIIRHGFLPPHGEEPDKFSNWKMEDWMTKPLSELFDLKQTAETPRASPSSTLSMDLIDDLQAFTGPDFF